MVTPLAEATTSEAVSQHGAAIIPDRSGSIGPLTQLKSWQGVEARKEECNGKFRLCARYEHRLRLEAVYR
jgi:hypothetical protein